MAIAITSVTPRRPMTLLLEFNDGTSREVDLTGQLDGPVFEALHNFEFFSRVRVDPRFGTVVWPNGVDLDPDVLHGSESPTTRPGLSELAAALQDLVQVAAEIARTQIARLGSNRHTRV